MLHKRLFIIFIMLITLCGNVFAQQDSLQGASKNTVQNKQQDVPSKAKKRYLQISTNPSTVDLYANNIQPDFAKNPDYVSPAFIPVDDGENSVTVSFFHPNYADTTINITLSSNDTSFIIIALRQSYDDEEILKKQDFLKHRSRRNLGNYMKWASIAPFAISGVSAIVSLYNNSKAKDLKKSMENTRFKTDKYDEHMKDFKNHRSSAKTAKTVSGIFFATGLAFLTVGFILSF